MRGDAHLLQMALTNVLPLPTGQGEGIPPPSSPPLWRKWGGREGRERAAKKGTDSNSDGGFAQDCQLSYKDDTAMRSK